MRGNGGQRKPGDRMVRRPRQRELEPVRLRPSVRRRVLIPASTSALLSLTLSFLALIAIGASLLFLPFASTVEGSAPLITALFTATSAVCVTGLVVVDSGEYWTGFGQAVIAGLMFAGGLGIMTAALVILTAVGRRITLNQRLVVREAMGGMSLGGVMHIGRLVIVFAVGAQIIGFVVLSIRLAFNYSLTDALWQGLFHSISAFNNAGFTIFPDSTSLSAFQSDHYVLWTVGVLILLGALSFPVINELAKRQRLARWSLDTRLVVFGMAGLWVLGGVAMLAFELTNPNTLGGMSLGDKISNAAFQATTSRTAGFSTVDFGQTRTATDFLFIMMMFVGGASGSVAGGIKINTAMVLVIAGLASVRGRTRAEVFRREIPYPQVARALAVLLLAGTALIVFVTALAASENSSIEQGLFSFTDVFFEAVSGFGTVGLSRGITPDLSDPGKLIVTAAMYVGRLGPLTIALGLALGERRVPYRYAREQVRIG